MRLHRESARAQGVPHVERPCAPVCRQSRFGLTTVVISLCHNTNDGSLNRTRPRTHLGSNQSSSSGIITRRQLNSQRSRVLESLNISDPPADGRDRGNKKMSTKFANRKIFRIRTAVEFASRRSDTSTGLASIGLPADGGRSASARRRV